MTLSHWRPSAGRFFLSVAHGSDALTPCLRGCLARGTVAPIMKVPYARCDLAAIRAENDFYVDKTTYLPNLEGVNEKHLIFLRPRRFGKTTLISTLENDYDLALG